MAFAFQQAPMMQQQQPQYSPQQSMSQSGLNASSSYAAYGGSPLSVASAPAGAMQQPPQSQQQAAPTSGTGAGTGGSSISQLVQALQSGSISKQQLYSSLTNMYKGQTPSAAAPAHSPSLQGSPAASVNSTFDLSFGSNNASQSFSQQQPPSQQQQQQPSGLAAFPAFQQLQPQSSILQSQYQLPPSLSSSFAAPPALAGAAGAAPSTAYSAAQAAAAQQHIQSFLSKRLANPAALGPAPTMATPATPASSASMNSSFNSNASLNLSNSIGNESIASILAQSQSAQRMQQLQQQQQLLGFGGGANANHSLDLSAASHPHMQAQQHPQQSFHSQPELSFYASGISANDTSGMMQQGYNPYQPQQQQQPFQPNLSLQSGQSASFQLQQMQQMQLQQQMQMQQQQQQQHGEAEEYTKTAVRGGGGGGAGNMSSRSNRSDRSNGPASSRSNSASARRSARERMAAVYTDEKNAELTFKPQIIPLPKGLYAKPGGTGAGAAAGTTAETTNDAPFLGRVMHWSENKRARDRQLSVELEKRALAECTFKPTINDESSAIVTAPGAAQRRLFSARSTARAKILELEVKRQEEEDFRSSCTFEPRLNRKSLAIASNMSARPAGGADGSAPPPTSAFDAELAECTFTPKVNEPRRAMTAANLYLEQNAFERLSSSGGGAAGEEDASGADAAGYGSEGGGGIIRRGRGRVSLGRDNTHARSRSHDRGRSASPSSARGGGASSSSGAGAAAATPANLGPPASFNEFLARLKFKEFQRLERLEALKVSEQADLQFGRPLLSKKSARIVKQSMARGDYMSPTKRGVGGLTKEQQEQEDAMDPTAAARRSDPQCTFAPAINPYSAGLSRRSFAEMSALEMARRNQNLEIKQNQALQKEMEQASFAPFLNHQNNPKMAAVDSRLRVLSEPDLYVERLHFQAKLREAEVARQHQIRLMEEGRECTFAPAVHEAPEFVKRIAKSIATQKAAANAANSKKKKEKQGWK